MTAQWAVRAVATKAPHGRCEEVPFRAPNSRRADWPSAVFVCYAIKADRSNDLSAFMLFVFAWCAATQPVNGFAEVAEALKTDAGSHV